MLLRLQNYSCTIRYRAGNEMLHADALSRLPTAQKNREIQLDIQINNVQFSNPRLEELRNETEKDETLHKLK